MLAKLMTSMPWWQWLVHSPQEMHFGLSAAMRNADHRAITLSDLNMLRGPGGAERTESEYRALLSHGGFETKRVLKAGRMNVIEAVAVE